MSRSRTAAAIRADAITMAIKKGKEGCPGCAREYFDVARRHGATEGEIQQAIGAASSDSPDGVSRRELLKLAALGAARMAVLSAAAGIVPQMVVQTAAAQSADGSQIAWGRAETSADTQEMIGIAPSGGVVSQIDVRDASILRSPDGTVLYAVSTSKTGATATAMIGIYSAATGALQQTVTGRPLSVGHERGVDAVSGALSADGHYLALLHQTMVVTPTGRQVTKRDAQGTQGSIAVDNISIVNGVEIIDLIAGRSLGYLQFDAAADNLLGGQIVVAPNGQSLYAFTLAGSLIPSVTVVQFDGQSLHPGPRATQGQNGHAISAGGSGFRAATRILPDNRTLIRVVGATVQWFDLSGLTLTASIGIPQPTSRAKVAPRYTLFSADGAMLYILNAADDTVQVIDTLQRTSGGSAVLPTGESATAVMAGARGGAVLSRDGTRLYAISGRGGDGIVVVSLPDLTILGHWLEGVYLRAVWLSQDQQTIYAAGLTNGQVYTVGNDGHIISATPVGATIYDFVG